MDAQELFNQLCQPFPVEYIQWRVGPTNERSVKEGDPIKGQPLCYIDSRAVMDRFDAVCGPGNWQCKHELGMGRMIVCHIGVRIGDDWVWKSDGAGATGDVTKESEREMAEKGAMSDAFKRAAVHWGVGRYLYDLKAPWITLEKRGKATIINDSEMRKLNELHEDFAHKAGWGIRAGVQAYKVLKAAIAHWVRSPSDVIDFRKNNAGMIAQLPVAMKRNLNETLDRIGAPSTQAAE